VNFPSVVEVHLRFSKTFPWNFKKVGRLGHHKSILPHIHHLGHLRSLGSLDSISPFHPKSISFIPYSTRADRPKGGNRFGAQAIWVVSDSTLLQGHPDHLGWIISQSRLSSHSGRSGVIAICVVGLCRPQAVTGS
jgi:hypothetical protein